MARWIIEAAPPRRIIVECRARSAADAGALARALYAGIEWQEPRPGASPRVRIASRRKS